jgi:SAM-dependent methyltransferase
MAEDVVERLGFLRWEGKTALISGLGGEAVAAALGRAATGPLDLAQPIAGGPYDLIVSLGELDTVNDLPGALILLRQALAPGGLLLAAMVGAGSVPKLRQAMLSADGERPAARIHPQVDHRAASALLQRAGFMRQVVDHHALHVRFGALQTLMNDMHDQGLGSVLADRSPTLGKVGLDRAATGLAEQADPDGKTSERFEIVTLTAWKD